MLTHEIEFGRKVESVALGNKCVISLIPRIHRIDGQLVNPVETKPLNNLFQIATIVVGHIVVLCIAPGSNLHLHAQGVKNLIALYGLTHAIACVIAIGHFESPGNVNQTFWLHHLNIT